MTKTPAIPECATCAALPAEPHPALRGTGKSGVHWRPPTPRPVAHGRGPTTWRCATHRRADEQARKQRQSDKRSRRRSGLDEETRQATLDEQGGRCPCGAALVPRSRKRLNPIADHSHALAAEHEHPDEVACEDCMRGWLCAHCNREVIGYLTQAGRSGGDRTARSDAEVADALQRLADYLRDPPAQRVIARRRAELDDGSMAYVHGLTA